MDDLLPPVQTLDNVRTLTAARIALGRTGDSIRTRDELAFQLDHAAARDAVHAHLNAGPLLDGLRDRRWAAVFLQSAACVDGWETNRRTYLQRPDLGRRLSVTAVEQLKKLGQPTRHGISVVIADGLSATAVERHALPFLDALLQCMPGEDLSGTPVCVVHNGRVAVGDEIGGLLQAEVCVCADRRAAGLELTGFHGRVRDVAAAGGADGCGAQLHLKRARRRSSLPGGCERLRAQLVRARQLGGTGVGAGGGDHRLAAASAVPTL